MRKFTWKVAGALSVLVVASAIVVAWAGAPEFSLFASPSVEWVTPIQLAHYRVEVKPAEGFSGDVSLSCRPDSRLITCSVLPNIVHVGPGDRPSPEILMLASAGAGTAFGTYSIQIIGTALPILGGDTLGGNETTVTLKVIPVVDAPTE
jgi:hypothetical protein